MKILNLNGKWAFRNTKENEWMEGKVPGSLLSNLSELGLIENPYYRDNEDKLFQLFKDNYEYRKEIYLNNTDLKHKKIALRLEGLDTVAEIYVNSNFVMKTLNMHRAYEFDIKNYLKEGNNEIKIIFSSPIDYVLKKQKEFPLYGIPMAVSGYTHLRKGHYMFGWDWGPKLPDCGIWKDVALLFYSEGRWEDIVISQRHEQDLVKLDIQLAIANLDGTPKTAEVNLTTPDGEIIHLRESINQRKSVEIIINNPHLWWPNGFGDQPLYKVECSLFGQNELIDKRNLKIGLRELTLNTDSDQWGSNFAFSINGIQIFSMGADYIPEDNIIGWTNKNKTEQLIKDCVKANFNTIRVWGGGIYPNDDFFNLCDEYGLIVWQDLMFACGTYDLANESFVESSIAEIRDNVRRIRHHACLGLICGNNEIEMFFEDGRIESSEANKENYLRFFEQRIPEVLLEEAPQSFYWPASPSSGGNFFETNGENHGDGHYWDVWHGNKPFSAYRETYFRFMSEFGFESLPHLKTIESFTEPEDRNIFSYIMEKHQKNPGGNTKILTYLAENYQYPKDFSSLVYISQILQAEAMRYGVEHWRRNRGRCMGTLYWQLNDCWPTSSWSSIDYYGRWKALHYAARRFYAPILLSAKEEGTKVELHLTNETLQDWEGTVSWYLMRQTGEVIQQETLNVQVDKLSSTHVLTKEFELNQEECQNVFFFYKLEKNDKVVSRGSVLFVPTKHFNFFDSKLSLQIDEDQEHYLIQVKSESFAKHVELMMQHTDVVFSENYFDLPAGQELIILINKHEHPDIKSVKCLEKDIRIRSYFDSY